MAYEYPEYNQHEIDHYHRQQCCQLTHQHHHPIRRRSISKRFSQPTTSHAPPFQQYYPRSRHFYDRNYIYEPPLRYGEPDEETTPDDLLLDDYYIDSAPVPPWPRPPPQQQLRQRPRLAVRRNYYQHEYEDDVFPERGLLFRDNKVNGVGRYFDPMTPSPLQQSRQSARPTYTSQQTYNISNRPTRKIYRTFERRYQPRQSLDLEFTDYSDDDGDEGGNILDSNHHQHRIRQQHITPMTKHPPRRRHSFQHLRRSSLWENSTIMGSSPDLSPIQPVLQPMRQTDTQRPFSFYGQAPANGPPLLPMPQPMIHAPSFLPYHSQQLGYDAPTMPSTAPGSSLPFNPMTMMMPPLPPTSLAGIQNGNGKSQQMMDTKTATPTAVPTPPPSDDTKSPLDSPNVNTSSPPVTSSLSSSTSAPASTKPSTNVENALVPLVRSLSLGESRSTGTKPPRRRSLFESLFSLDGFKLSRNNSLSSNSNSTNDSTSSPATTITATSSPSMIPVHELTTHTLTRKQSLSLEKKVKALSQRSYIWCYQIKSVSGIQQKQQQQESGCWVAMTPKNQIKLDPYICYYQPSAKVKGVRTDNLSTLVTLDKEPKLSGSFTVMPQAKIARVYPSMFSSANYVEVMIACLPADGQFVVRSS